MNGKLLLGALIILALGFASCEGPEGPVGPVGPAGANGVNGQDGQNGATTCTDCHGSSQVITAKLFQWESSVHATGGHYERNTASCAGCHTSQGFLDQLASGGTSASMDIDDPLPQNCYTCHQIHSTYTDADWALTTSEAKPFWVGGETVDLGSANLCITCHQSRVPSPAVPEPGTTGTVNLTNKRYGPHHGSQGAVFTGSSAYKVGTGYENSSHTTLIQNACVACHMAPVTGGKEAGGHTFRVTSVDGDLNTNGCVQCHSDTGALEDAVEATQTEIEGLLTELGTKLNQQGLLDDDLAYAVVPQDFTNVQLGVLWNYQYVKEDNSLGVHNYKFVKTLLTNSIAALD